MQFFALIKLLLSLLPAVIECVKAVESAFPSLSGSSKLGMVMNTVQTAANHASDMEQSFEAIAGPVQTMVNGVVSTFNAAGIFAHGVTAAASSLVASAPAAAAAPIITGPMKTPSQALAKLQASDAIGG
ncbi:MAG: hypothetical protein KGJ21_10870 [Pseudomonadota bacterium]|nr:hypothetical protein [Pseudomonadota bacterium]